MRRCRWTRNQSRIKVLLKSQAFLPALGESLHVPSSKIVVVLHFRQLYHKHARPCFLLVDLIRRIILRERYVTPKGFSCPNLLDHHGVVFNFGRVMIGKYWFQDIGKWAAVEVKSYPAVVSTPFHRQRQIRSFSCTLLLGHLLLDRLLLGSCTIFNNKVFSYWFWDEQRNSTRWYHGGERTTSKCLDFFGCLTGFV